MDLSVQNNYTTDYIYNLPDGKRAELIDGRVYMMAPPSRLHQEISFELSRKIADYIDSKKGDCKVYLAPFAVFLNQDNKTYVEPDISIVCDKDKLTDQGCNGAPDWVIEVVSPGSERMDYLVKMLKYSGAGVREYWIVDHGKNRIITYHFEKDDVMEYNFQDKVKVGIYEDLEIDFLKLV